MLQVAEPIVIATKRHDEFLMGYDGDGDGKALNQPCTGVHSRGIVVHALSAAMAGLWCNVVLLVIMFIVRRLKVVDVMSRNAMATVSMNVIIVGVMRWSMGMGMDVTIVAVRVLMRILEVAVNTVVNGFVAVTMTVTMTVFIFITVELGHCRGKSHKRQCNNELGVHSDKTLFR